MSRRRIVNLPHADVNAIAARHATPAPTLAAHAIRAAVEPPRPTREIETLSGRGASQASGDDRAHAAPAPAFRHRRRLSIEPAMRAGFH